DIQLLEFPYGPSFSCESLCVVVSEKLPELVAFVPALASAMLRGLGCAVKTSSSSRHGSTSDVAATVNRTYRASTGTNRSTFAPAVTGARSTGDALGSLTSFSSSNTSALM